MNDTENTQFWQHLHSRQRVLDDFGLDGIPDEISLLEIISDQTDHMSALEEALNLKSCRTRHGWRVMRDDG